MVKEISANKKQPDGKVQRWVFFFCATLTICALHTENAYLVQTFHFFPDHNQQFGPNDEEDAGIP